MPVQRISRRALRAGVGSAERRSWASNAAAALGVTVLGLGLASSITLTTNAQPTTSSSGRVATAPSVTAPRVPKAAATPSVDPSVAAPFTAPDDEGQTAELREALVAERAAQRAEELAKNAEVASRTARTASSKSRQAQLDADGDATREKGQQLAKEALDRAVAARIAAVTARINAEAAQAAKEAAEQAAQQESAGQASNDGGAAAAPAAPAPPPPPAPAPAPAPMGSGNGGGGGGGGDSRDGVAPVPGAVVGAGFGEVGLWARYHTGLDFRAGYGTPIRAVRSGTVLYAGNTGSWAGNHVAVRHGDGMTTMSSHMSSMSVGAGQSVQAGQVIGYVGSTGRSFGAHLHFELYPAGVRYGDLYQAVNPIPWLRDAGVITR